MVETLADGVPLLRQDLSKKRRNDDEQSTKIISEISDSNFFKVSSITSIVNIDIYTWSRGHNKQMCRLRRPKSIERIDHCPEQHPKPQSPYYSGIKRGP
jgi:hypothetical protein